jgi:sugar diacid utilization regulator
MLTINDFLYRHVKDYNVVSGSGGLDEQSEFIFFDDEWPCSPGSLLILRKTPIDYGRVEKMILLAKCTGLILWDNAENIPASLIEVSNNRSIPIVLLPSHVGATNVLRSVLQERDITIGNKLPQHMRLQRLLIQVALENKGLQNMIEVIANHANVQVIVQDIKGLILGKAGNPVVAEVFQRVTDIKYNGDDIGKIYIIADEQQHANLSQFMLDFIASLIALEIYKQKQFVDAASKRRVDFVYDLLSGDNIRDENIITRSRYLGIELQQTMGLLVVDIDDFVKFAMGHDEQYVTSVKKQIYMTTALAVDMKSIVIPRSDKLIVIIPLQNDNYIESEKGCLALATKLRRLIAEKVNGVTTTIGIGSICKNLLDLRTSYIEASEAINIGRIALGKDRIINYKDLGVFLLLPSLLRDNPNLSMLFTHWFGKIIDYDRTKGTDLLKTLETYLETNCDIHETTAKLHIHRNTLRYRLEKLNELTDGRFTMPENKFQYLLLVKIWRLSK